MVQKIVNFYLAMGKRLILKYKVLVIPGSYSAQDVDDLKVPMRRHVTSYAACSHLVRNLVQPRRHLEWALIEPRATLC